MLDQNTPLARMIFWSSLLAEAHFQQDEVLQASTIAIKT